MPHLANNHRIALAHHWMMSMRGGEKTLAVLAAMFPQAPIFTLLVRPGKLSPQLHDREIYTSWLQRFGRIPNLQRKALPLLVSASRSLDARDFDVVICSDAALIKAIRTRPDALKLCYCHSPMRYVWDMYDEYLASAGTLGKIGLRLLAPRLRRADKAAAQTMTAFIANSRCVADRIRRCYGRESVVIHPPVEVDYPEPVVQPDDFYLVVAEQVGYKRTDLAIDACTQLGRWLVVIGEGPEFQAMKRRAGRTISLLGWQPDEVVRDHLRRCRALLFCGCEDFGMVPVEAQAAGRPVIAYRAGGAVETVVEGRTGLFFDRPEVESVVQAIRQFEAAGPLGPPARIQNHARRFGVEAFRRRFEGFFERCLGDYTRGGAESVREGHSHHLPPASEQDVA